jgi:predicted transposase/invertase (TIGR01784 family)
MKGAVQVEKKPLSPITDFVFKKVFGENKLVLRGFLESALEISADDLIFLEVLDPTLKPENKDDKRCVLDIKLKTKNGKVIDIELQAKGQDFIWKRIQYYAAKLLTEQAKRGDQYRLLPQVISVLIADFKMIKESENFCHRFSLYDKVNNVSFPDSMEVITLEIQKVNDSDQSPLSQWMRFFKAREKEDFEMVAQTNPAINTAWGVVQILSEEESARMIAEAQEKAYKDRVSAEDEAYNHGQQKLTLELIKMFLKKKMPVDEITKFTKLPLDAVNKLEVGLQEWDDETALEFINKHWDWEMPVVLFTETERLSLDVNMKIAKGWQEGWQEGLQEGEQKATLKIIENLLEMKMDVDGIAKATKLPLDEVKKLIAQLSS